MIFNTYIPVGTKIGFGISIGHPYGIIINRSAIIGNGVRINHQVTIGESTSGVPIIEDDVFIGAGAKVIGGIRVSSRSQIGANAVVVKDIDNEGVYVGVPARKV